MFFQKFKYITFDSCNIKLKFLGSFFEKELLDEEGMLVVEHSKYTKLDQMPNYSFQKNYGGSVFSFFEFESEED